jgi:DNA-binding transcriptional ArsR family regulator
MALALDLIEEAAYRFALLGDPTRLRILRALMETGELSVGTVANMTGTSRFNASAHLNRLALAGLVARRREASTVYYRVDDVNLPKVCEWMCDSLRSRARTLAG